jgi:hypothetical protein
MSPAAPTWDDDARALARFERTGDLTEFGQLYVCRGGNPIVGRRLQDRKEHRGRGRSALMKRDARFINAVKAATKRGMSKVAKFTLIENTARDYGLIDEDGYVLEKAFGLVAGKYPKTSRLAKRMRGDKNRPAQSKGGSRRLKRSSIN